MPKKGYNRDARAISWILHNATQEAVDAAAEELLAAADDPEAFLSAPYHTDRYVRALVVPADNQAKHGSATRARGRVEGR